MSEQYNPILSAEDLNPGVDDTPKAIVEATPIVPAEMSPTDRLIMMALEGNVDVSKLEKLIELKNAEEERTNKREFDRQFANMQKNLPVIKKGQGCQGQRRQGAVLLRPAG